MPINNAVMNIVPNTICAMAKIYASITPSVDMPRPMFSPSFDITFTNNTNCSGKLTLAIRKWSNQAVEVLGGDWCGNPIPHDTFLYYIDNNILYIGVKAAIATNMKIVINPNDVQFVEPLYNIHLFDDNLWEYLPLTPHNIIMRVPSSESAYEVTLCRNFNRKSSYGSSYIFIVNSQANYSDNSFTVIGLSDYDNTLKNPQIIVSTATNPDAQKPTVTSADANKVTFSWASSSVLRMIRFL